MKALVWVGCVACTFSPPQPLADDPGEAGVLDEAGRDVPGAVELCATTPRLDEEFDGTTPCQPWGSTFGTATLAQGSGVLRVTPTTIASNSGCAELANHAWSSAIVEVPSILTGLGAFTVFQLLSLDRTLGAANGVLFFSNGNSTVVFSTTPFIAADMRWWRMRRGDDTVIAEYSADARTWTMLFAQPTQLGEMRINLIAGATTTVPQGSAEYARLAVCP